MLRQLAKKSLMFAGKGVGLLSISCVCEYISNKDYNYIYLVW